MAGTQVVEMCESWEEQTTEYFDGVNGSTLSFVSSPALYGGKSVRMNVSSSYCYINAGGTAYQKNIGTYFRFATLPTTNIYLFMVGQVSSTTNYRGIKYDASSGKLRPFAKGTDGGSIVESDGPVEGPVIQTNTWYYINFLHNYPVTSTISWNLAEEGDAPVMYEWAHPAKTGGALGTIIFGNHSSAPTGTYDIYYGPTVAVFYNSLREPVYPLPPFKVKTLSLNGVGTHVNDTYFTDSNGNNPPVNPHNLLNTLPKGTSTSQWVKQITADANSYLEYTLENLPAGAQSVLTLLGRVSGSNETQALSDNEYKFVLDSVTYSGGMSAFYTSKRWGGWAGAYRGVQPTVTGVNNMLLRQGYNTDVTPNVRVHDLWLNVAYIEGTSGTATHVLDAYIGSVDPEPQTAYRREITSLYTRQNYF